IRMRDGRAAQARHGPSDLGRSVRREEHVAFRDARPGRLDARRPDPHRMPAAVVREAEKNVDEVHVPGGTNRVHENLGWSAAPLRLDRVGEAPLRNAEAVLNVRPRDPADEARDVENGRHEDEAEKGCAPGAPVARGERLHEGGGPERREREDERGPQESRLPFALSVSRGAPAMRSAPTPARTTGRSGSPCRAMASPRTKNSAA